MIKVEGTVHNGIEVMGYCPIVFLEIYAFSVMTIGKGHGLINNHWNDLK